VVLEGDSITEGLVDWSLAIRQASDAHYAVNKPTFVNYGTSGYNVTDIDTRIANDIVVEGAASLWIIRIGINDVFHGTTEATFNTRIASIAAKIIAGGVTPGNVLFVDNLVLGERPIDGTNSGITFGGGTSNDAGILTFNRRLQNMCARNGFLFAETRDKFWRPWETANNTANPPVGDGIFTAPFGTIGVHPSVPLGRDLLGNWVLSNYVAFS
jgi:lysophospholipase L1-like esterase